MADLDFKLIIDAVTEGFDSAQKKVDGLFGSIESNSKKLESAGKKLSGFLTAPIAAFAAFSIAAFKDQEKNITKFTDSFQKQGGRIGFTFDELTKKADDFSKTSLFQDDDILGGVTSQLLNFDITNKTIFDDAQKVILDFASKTGQDLNSATLAIGKALQNPAEGLTLLRRQGVAVTDSQVSLVTQLDKTGKSAEAQAAVIKILKDQYDGFAQTIANTDTGRFDTLIKTFREVREAFGQAFLTVFRPFINILIEFGNVIKNLQPQSLALIAGFASIVAAIGPVILIVGQLTTAFGALGISLFAIAGPAGLLALLAGGLIASVQAFGTLGNAANNFALQINKDFLALFQLVDKIPVIFNFLPQVALLKTASSALKSTVESNIAFLNGEIDAFIANTGNKIEAQPFIAQKKELSPEELAAIKKLADERAKFLQDATDEANAKFRAENAGPGFFEGSFNLPGELDNAGGSFRKAAGEFAEVKKEVIELSATERILSDSFATFFENLAFGAKSAADAFRDLGRTIVQSLFSTALRAGLNSVFSGIFANGKDPLGSGSGGGTLFAASGGHIKGPGTGTSDSILARLSNGEFVMRAASVQKFGADFFHSLNKGLVPKFNIGGKVSKIKQNLSGIPRLATGGLVSQQSPVNVQVINNSSQPVQAKTNRIIDPSGTIIQIVLEDLKNNGPISQQFQGAFGVSR
ncbi:MAG TPA: hypothetical protein PLO52_01440 [Flavobacterium alvei]|nr:hypothetical protein [Flavobacterium alvei]